MKRKGSSYTELDESDEDIKQIAKQPVGKKKKTIQEEREERVQTTIEKLKERHGATYTPMQI